ncbi:MAG: hypothetical protein H0W12_03075 [Chitinophagaceae bacterium]|nr:hypothetical protein [Chitinophagaceae bacterium]
MKNLFISSTRWSKHFSGMNYNFFKMHASIICITILAALFFTSCQKESVSDAKSNSVLSGTNDKLSSAKGSDGNVVNMYSGLSSQTTWELQQARSATARYRDIKNAIKDGYSNINVDVPMMGHHFMRASIVDNTFDIRTPEILVYNGLDTGNPELVAVEYAVPIDQVLPEGFTGSNDVWNGTSGFPFWFVHAWVWRYNPAGVFNWTNPTVDLD